MFLKIIKFSFIIIFLNTVLLLYSSFIFASSDKEKNLKEYCEKNDYLTVREGYVNSLEAKFDNRFILAFCLYAKLELGFGKLNQNELKKIEFDKKSGLSLQYFLYSSQDKEVRNYFYKIHNRESLNNLLLSKTLDSINFFAKESSKSQYCIIADRFFMDEWYGSKISKFEKYNEILAWFDLTTNFQVAEYFYTLCADDGNEYASLQVARFNATGFGGIRVNCTKAEKYLSKVLAYYDHEGIANRYAGYAYSNGVCVPKNYDLAFEHFVKSARHGDKYSEQAVGWSYQYGCGTEIDIQKAKEYYEKAAYKDEVEAIINLGHLYASEVNFFDPKLSMQYLTEALEIDPLHGYANYFMALNYHKLPGFQKDIKLAINYYEKAAKAGVISARHELLEIYKAGIMLGNIKDAETKLIYWKNFKINTNNEWSPSLINSKSKETLLKANTAELFNFKSDCFQKYLEENIENYTPYKNSVALIIANSTYNDNSFKQLKTPINDGREVEKILKTKYGYEVTFLENASKNQIIDSLKSLKESMSPSDGLLIYYAGHADVGKKNKNEGFLQPIDSIFKKEETWISYNEVKKIIKSIDVKDIIFIVDACYPGNVLRGVEEVTNLNLWEESQAFVAIASANYNQPIRDEWNYSNHSLFALKFLKNLKELNKNTKAYDLFARLHTEITDESGNSQFPQNPLYASVDGHNSGDFVFFPLIK